MSQRRVKSIMHGSAEGTRVYHHEHRSKGGRTDKRKIISKYRSRASYERYIGNKEDQRANDIMRNFNQDPEYRKNFKHRFKNNNNV
jgi:hypothetical protein